MRRKILIILVLAALFSSAEPQVRTKNSIQNSEVLRQNDLKNLERQLSFVNDLERKGNYASAYNSYLQLMRNYDNDFRVLSGFTEASIKTGRVKECEIKLKETVKKYPSKPGYIDKNDAEMVYPLMIKALLAEMFLRTDRDDQAYLIFDEIDKADTGKDLKLSIKAYVFLKSGRYNSAEKMYLALRKDSKNSSAYSQELYFIYLSTERITKAVTELFNMSDVSTRSSREQNNLSAINPSSEIFALFDDPKYKDSVLISAEKQPKNPKNSELLSELYFNQGFYDKALSSLDHNGKSESREMLLADFAVRLYSEKKYSEAVSFFEQAFKEAKSGRTDDFTELYISSLVLSDRTAQAVGVIKKSGLKEKNLLLAEIYHNRLDSLNKADDLYRTELVSPNENLIYWKDYVKLKIAKKEFLKAEDMLKKIMNSSAKGTKTIADLNELKYYESVLQLLKGETDDFIRTADVLARDMTIADLDNDLLKAISDVKTVRDHKEFFDQYKNVLVHKIDKTSKIPESECTISKDADPSVKNVYYETCLYIQIARDDKEKIVRLMGETTENNMISNYLAKMFVEYCRGKKSDPEINSVLMGLLKSVLSDEIKAEIREVIREKQVS